MAKKVQRLRVFGSHKRKAEALNYKYAEEGSKFFLGPMPVRDFLDAFFPKVSLKEMPSSKGAFEKVPCSGDEKDIYESLARVVVSCHL